MHQLEVLFFFSLQPEEHRLHYGSIAFLREKNENKKERVKKPFRAIVKGSNIGQRQQEV